MNKQILSKNIKVYPTAYRDKIKINNQEYLYDPESKFSTESNIIKPYQMLSNHVKESYASHPGSFVISDNLYNEEFEFVINGYWFKIKNEDIFNNFTSGKCYAYIVLMNRGNDSNNTTYINNNIDFPAQSLYDIETELLTLDNEGMFKGLVLDSRDKDEFLKDSKYNILKNNTNYELCYLLLSEKEQIPEYSKLKFSSKDIDGGAGIGLDKQLNTEHINASSNINTKYVTTERLSGKKNEPINLDSNLIADSGYKISADLIESKDIRSTYTESKNLVGNELQIDKIKRYHQDEKDVELKNIECENAIRTEVVKEPFVPEAGGQYSGDTRVFYPGYLTKYWKNTNYFGIANTNDKVVKFGFYDPTYEWEGWIDDKGIWRTGTFDFQGNIEANEITADDINVRRTLNLNQEFNLKGNLNAKRNLNVNGDVNVKGDLNLTWKNYSKGMMLPFGTYMFKVNCKWTTISNTNEHLTMAQFNDIIGINESDSIFQPHGAVFDTSNPNRLDTIGYDLFERLLFEDLEVTNHLYPQGQIHSVPTIKYERDTGNSEGNMKAIAPYFTSAQLKIDYIDLDSKKFSINLFTDGLYLYKTGKLCIACTKTIDDLDNIISETALDLDKYKYIWDIKYLRISD